MATQYLLAFSILWLYYCTDAIILCIIICSGGSRRVKRDIFPTPPICRIFPLFYTVFSHFFTFVPHSTTPPKLSPGSTTDNIWNITTSLIFLCFTRVHFTSFLHLQGKVGSNNCTSLSWWCFLWVIAEQVSMIS